MKQVVREVEAEPLSRERAREQIRAAGFRASEIGPVGLELEFHLYDAACLTQPLDWSRVEAVVAALTDLPGGSTVSVEPGGQLELSTPPAADVVAAVAALRADQRVLITTAQAAGLLPLTVGADPWRTPRRVNPAPRYVGMEQYFASFGCSRTGRAMMTATAALQVNLDAGPSAGWGARLAHLHRLAPVLLALSACSPQLGGESSGWRSMRQQCWWGIDPARCGPVHGAGEPAEAWADYALAAPVMLVHEGGTLRPAPAAIPMADWIDRPALLGRRPTADDLAYHLTTLFPPVRPRGYLELRFLDAVPLRWWPGLAALVATVMDDPRTAEGAAEACAEVGPWAWTVAARDGLADPRLASMAGRLVEVAVDHVPAVLRTEAESYADLVLRGHTPGDRWRTAIGEGTAAALREALDED